MTKELVLARELNAPLEKVWQAWIDPELVKRWWGPNGTTIPVCNWDAQVGGELYIVMLAGPELGPMAGQEWPMRGQFSEVVPGKKLVFTNTPLDAEGKKLMEGVTTVTLEPQGDNTNLTVSNTVTTLAPAAEQMVQGMEQGWNEQLNKLAAFLK